MATIILTHQGAEVVARLSEWHAADRFHHVPAKPGADPEYRLIGLSDAEARQLAAKVNALVAWAKSTPAPANPVRQGGNIIPLPPRLFHTHPEARA